MLIENIQSEIHSHRDEGFCELNSELDVLDMGGGCYYVVPLDQSFVTALNFHSGPIEDGVVKGISLESVVAILQDRLQKIQSGEHACEEFSSALHHLTLAASALRHRQLRTMLDESDSKKYP